jgi:hypothetical protein
VSPFFSTHAEPLVGRRQLIYVLLYVLLCLGLGGAALRRGEERPRRRHRWGCATGVWKKHTPFILYYLSPLVCMPQVLLVLQKIRTIFVSPNKFIKKLDSNTFLTILLPPFIYLFHLSKNRLFKNLLRISMGLWVWLLVCDAHLVLIDCSLSAFIAHWLLIGCDFLAAPCLKCKSVLFNYSLVIVLKANTKKIIERRRE